MTYTKKENITQDLEIKETKAKQAVEIVDLFEQKTDQCLSALFILPKKDGGIRQIFNIKKLNEFIRYEHFKMEGFQVVKTS